MSLEGGVPEAAAIYCRISDDRQGRALGVARQEADCRELAARKGWTVAGLYVDNDISAADVRKRRPEYERLLADIKAGIVDGVLAWDADRLHRRPVELEKFFEVADAAGLRYLATVGGDIDLATGDGLLVARIKGAVAADEVAKNKRRVRRKHRELAEAGAVSGGGSRPFGFEDDRLTVRESEAAVVREAMARALAGESLRGLCEDLAARGITTSAGNAWKPTGLSRVLGSARICGQRELHGVVSTAQWPAIVPPADVAAFRAMGQAKAVRHQRAPQRYLLSGLVVCSACGTRMVARPRDDGVRRYVCAKGVGFSGCGKTYIKAEPLEGLICEAVLVRLDSPDLAAGWVARQVEGKADDAETALVSDQQLLDELATAYGHRQLTLREFLAARAPIEARIDQARTALIRASSTGQLREFIGHADRLAAEWDGMDFDRRHALIGHMLDRATIGPGVRGRARFDPDRVTPTWKF